jgi:hypothetical protein
MINADRRFVDTSAPIAILAVREYGSGREWHDERYRDFRRRNGHYREVKLTESGSCRTQKPFRLWSGTVS